VIGKITSLHILYLLTINNLETYVIDEKVKKLKRRNIRDDIVKICDLNLFWNHFKSFTNKTLHFNKNNINKISASCYAWQIICWIFLIIKNKVFILRNASLKSNYCIFFFKAVFLAIARSYDDFEYRFWKSDDRTISQYSFERIDLNIGWVISI